MGLGRSTQLKDGRNLPSLFPESHSPLHVHVLFFRAWVPNQRHCHRVIGDYGPGALALLMNLLLFVSLEPLIRLCGVKERKSA